MTDRVPLRVLVVAAYPSVRAGLAALLAREVGLEVEETDGRVGETAAAVHDVTVIDLTGFDDDWVESRVEHAAGRGLVLLGANPEVDGPGLSTGAIAYLGSNTEAAALVAAVRAVFSGLTVVDPALLVAARIASHAPGVAIGGAVDGQGDALTAREREVLRLVADGLPNKGIARELGISEHTAKFHVGSLLAKLGAGSRTEAVTIATRRGVLSI